MKIRIKDNSIRLRLTKTDVAELKENRRVAGRTVFSKNQIFRYILEVESKAVEISAVFEDNTIIMKLPLIQANMLTETDAITIKGSQSNGEDGDLFLLIEKDLECIDATDEDQSDMYENKKTIC